MQPQVHAAKKARVGAGADLAAAAAAVTSDGWEYKQPWHCLINPPGLQQPATAAVGPATTSTSGSTSSRPATNTTSVSSTAGLQQSAQVGGAVPEAVAAAGAVPAAASTVGPVPAAAAATAEEPVTTSTSQSSSSRTVPPVIKFSFYQ